MVCSNEGPDAGAPGRLRAGAPWYSGRSPFNRCEGIHHDRAR
jgi:hypothetical protein